MAISLLLSSCGGFIKDAELSSYHDQNNDYYARLEFILNLDDVRLPTVTIPIYDTEHWEDKYGQVAIIGGFNGDNQVKMDANLSKIFNQEIGGEGTLPDGTPLTNIIYGLNGVEIIQIPIGGHKHFVYFAAEKNVALMGVALTFKELDKVAKEVHGANVIIPFEFKDKDIKGSSGFFFSQEEGKSGFCAFFDISKIIYPEKLVELKHSIPKRSNDYLNDFNQSKLQFLEVRMSQEQEEKLMQFVESLQNEDNALVESIWEKIIIENQEAIKKAYEEYDDWKSAEEYWQQSEHLLYE